MSFTSIFSFDNYINANLRMMQLQEEGISCWLKDEYTVTIDPFLSNAIGGIKLMVHETQKDRAVVLLRTMMNKEKENRPCPNCGSFNVEYIVSNRKPSNWLSAIFTYLIYGYPMADKKMYHCFDCGHEFENVKEEARPDDPVAQENNHP